MGSPTNCFPKGGSVVSASTRSPGVQECQRQRFTGTGPRAAPLLLDACSKIGTPPEVPDTGSLLGDVTALATHLADQLQNARWPAVLTVDNRCRGTRFRTRPAACRASWRVDASIFRGTRTRTEKGGIGTAPQSFRGRRRNRRAALLPSLVLERTYRRSIRGERRPEHRRANSRSSSATPARLELADFYGRP